VISTFATAALSATLQHDELEASTTASSSHLRRNVRGHRLFSIAHHLIEHTTALNAQFPEEQAISHSLEDAC
jgi:hypothetical protein